MEIQIIEVISSPPTPFPSTPLFHKFGFLRSEPMFPRCQLWQDVFLLHCQLYTPPLSLFWNRDYAGLLELWALLLSLNLHYSNLIQEGFLRSQTISRVLIYILSYSALMSPIRFFNICDQTFFFWFLLHTAQWILVRLTGFVPSDLQHMEFSQLVCSFTWSLFIHWIS